jgi:integrase
MFAWAVERSYLDRNPFRDGARLLIKAEREDNKRHRRLSPELEAKLLDAAAPLLRPMIIAALDTGMRRGEMLALTWADVDQRPGRLRLRGTTTKSGKTRWIPDRTVRLQGVLAFVRIEAAGQSKPSDARVFSNEAGEPIQGFRTALMLQSSERTTTNQRARPRTARGG